MIRIKLTPVKKTISARLKKSSESELPITDGEEDNDKNNPREEV
jgi:hypothetical protein